MRVNVITNGMLFYIHRKLLSVPRKYFVKILKMYIVVLSQIQIYIIALPMRNIIKHLFLRYRTL